MKYAQIVPLLVTLSAGMAIGIMMSRPGPEQPRPRVEAAPVVKTSLQDEPKLVLADPLQAEMKTLREQLRTQQRLSAREIASLTAALDKAHAEIAKRERQSRKTRPKSVAQVVAEDPEFYAEKVDAAARYTPYMPFRAYRLYRPFKDYTQAEEKRSAGSKADCDAHPFAAECRGTFASCQLDSDTDDCIGTDIFCREFPTLKYCVGTESYCIKKPLDAHCAGTQAWCREKPGDKICGGTKPFCEKQPHHASCLGTKLYCEQVGGKPCL